MDDFENSSMKNRRKKSSRHHTRRHTKISERSNESMEEQAKHKKNKEKQIPEIKAENNRYFYAVKLTEQQEEIKQLLRANTVLMNQHKTQAQDINDLYRCVHALAVQVQAHTVYLNNIKKAFDPTREGSHSQESQNDEHDSESIA